VSALLSTAEIAERLGVSTRTARRLIGEMRPVDDATATPPAFRDLLLSIARSCR